MNIARSGQDFWPGAYFWVYFQFGFNHKSSFVSSLYIGNYPLYWCVEPTYIKVPDYKEKHLRLTLQYFYNTRDITFFHFSPAEGPKTSFFLWP